MFVKEWWHERPKHHVSRVSGGQILGQQKCSESSDTPKGQGPRAIEDIILFSWQYVEIASTNRLWSSPLAQRRQARNFIQLD